MSMLAGNLEVWNQQYWIWALQTRYYCNTIINSTKGFHMMCWAFVAIILGCYNETKSAEWPFLVRSLTYVYILMITEWILTLATSTGSRLMFPAWGH